MTASSRRAGRGASGRIICKTASLLRFGLGKRERRNSTIAGRGKSEVRLDEREEERKAGEVKSDTARFTGFRVQ